MVNGKAGSLAGLKEPRAALAAALRSGGFMIRDDMDEAASLDAQWAAVEAGDARVVFVAGGDGTLRDAASRLIDGERGLAPLPGGTMNRVCARLGLIMDPVEAAKTYRPGAFVTLDVATANGEVFLYQSIVGAPTRLMRIREMQRGGGARGWWPLVRAGLRELGRPSSRGLSIRTGVRQRARGHAAVVTLPEPAGPPRLTCHLARPVGIYSRLRQAVRWFRGELGKDAEVATHSDGRLVVHGRTPWLRLSLDGEMRLVQGPLKFRLHPGRLKLLVPPEGAG